MQPLASFVVIFKVFYCFYHYRLLICLCHVGKSQSYLHGATNSRYIQFFSCRPIGLLGIVIAVCIAIVYYNHKLMGTLYSNPTINYTIPCQLPPNISAALLAQVSPTLPKRDHRHAL